MKSLVASLLLILAMVHALIAAEPLAATEHQNRLVITQGKTPVGDFVFIDPVIRRPFFANLRAPGGIQVTRNFPPIKDKEPTDHADMHPGLWLAFGDLAGTDFWRNKGDIRHDRFSEKPAWKNDRLTFTTDSTLLTTNLTTLATLHCVFTLTPKANALAIRWDATLTPVIDGFYFGDQEEMGLGVRVATAITEKNGGMITSSTGLTTAKKTWGQPAAWCDSSGIIDGKHVGILIAPDPGNARPSWWHNRDYGVFVANAFGQKAMKQGPASRVEIKRGEPYRLRHTIILHANEKNEPPHLNALVKDFAPTH